MNKRSLKSIICVILSVVMCVLFLCSCSVKIVVPIPGGTPDSGEQNPPYTGELPASKPTDPLTLTFCDTPYNRELITANATASFEVTKDRAKGMVLKLTGNTSDKSLVPTVKIDYKRYMELSGLDPASLDNCKYAVCTVKVEKTYDSRMNIKLSGIGDNGSAVSTVGEAIHRENVYTWQFVTVALMEDDTGVSLDEIEISFLESPKSNEALYIQSISFFENHIDSLTFMELDPYSLIKSKTFDIYVEGISKEYKFLSLTDTHVSVLSSADRKLMSTSRYEHVAKTRSDYRINGVLTEDRFSSYLKLAEEENVDLVMVTGDAISFPSEGNFNFLRRLVKTSKTKIFFTTGNHDWTFFDDYQTPNAAATYFPKLENAINQDPHFSYIEYDDIIVVTVDNSDNKIGKDTVDKFFALYEKNKPIVLNLHVPLYSDELYNYTQQESGASYIMGGNGLNGDDPEVKRFYEAVCVDTNSPVIAVFSGHIHLEYQGALANGVPQYITYPAFDGGCAVINIKPKA